MKKIVTVAFAISSLFSGVAKGYAQTESEKPSKTSQEKEASTSDTSADSSSSEEGKKDSEDQSNKILRFGQSKRLGVGVQLAYGLLGATGKYYFAERQAFQLNLGISTLYNVGGFGTTLDYSYDVPISSFADGGLFLGIGGGPGFYRFSSFGVSLALLDLHLKVGVGYQFYGLPLELATNWRPSYNFLVGSTVSLTSSERGRLNGLAAGSLSLALRYYF